MALKITDSHISTTKRRIQLVARQAGFLVEAKTYSIRFLSKDELPTGMRELKELVEKVIENKRNWLQGKKYPFYRMPEINATVIILKESIDGEDTAD